MHARGRDRRQVAVVRGLMIVHHRDGRWSVVDGIVSALLDLLLVVLAGSGSVVVIPVAVHLGRRWQTGSSWLVVNHDDI